MPKPPNPKKRRLPLSKLLILYFLSNRGYDGSILQLSRDMGYSTDSSVNKNLNDLIRDGYVTDGPVYKLTPAGVREIQFSRLPEVLCYLILGLGISVLLISGEGVAGFVAERTASLSTFGLGVAIVTIGVLFLGAKKRVYDDFLGLRKPLSHAESAPREDREPDSAG